MSSLKLEFEKIEKGQGSLAVIELDRPKSLNALSVEVLEEFSSSLQKIGKRLVEEPLHGLFLKSNSEKAFIAGADISEMQKMKSAEALEFGRLGQEVFSRIEALPFPTFALVNGFALGGGCECALSCDFILATEKAVFGQPEVRLGLIPGFGGTQRLARRVPLGFAKDLIYSGRQIDGKTAYEKGLADRLCEDQSALEKEAREMLKEMVKSSPVAITKSKEALQRGLDLSLEKGLELEVRLFSELFTSEDTKEGLSAFVEKRKPSFKGK
jgi:enoyl-CoA hydratase